MLKGLRKLAIELWVLTFTLTITSQVTTEFVDGEDPTTHIAKMKGHANES